jgi:hypothetical protein
MYKNRRHPTEAECRLFCCPIPLSRCRFCSFLKLLSYRHTAKAPALFFWTAPQPQGTPRRPAAHRVHPLRLRVQGKTPPPRRSQGTPLAVKGAGQDPARQATEYKRRCSPLPGMASQRTIERMSIEYLCYQRRRRCMRVRLMVRDSENPRRFAPMNLSAACITDGYTRTTFESK